MDNGVATVKENLDIFLEELNGIDLVLNKLESRSSVSVLKNFVLIVNQLLVKLNL